MIDTALCLPAADIEALLQGRTVVVILSQDIDPGDFALYSCDASLNLLPTEQYYRSSFVTIAEKAFSETGIIKAWGKCQFCQIWDSESLAENEAIEIISKLTTWTTTALHKISKQREYIFLAYFYVYRLPKQITISQLVNAENLFFPLATPLEVFEETAVLTNSIFNKRCQQLQNLQPPEHPEIEELQGAIAHIAQTNLNAKYLEQEIHDFLGWSQKTPITNLDPELNWIHDITALGNRSIELDEGKSNYQAGTDFENIVRKSLEFLGFTVDEAYQGGAGGLDLFCSKPYPLVGECKAGKKIPSKTTEELIKLGGMHLGQDQFILSSKLVIGPGKPTSDVLKASAQWRVSIINAMSLEKLVHLQAKYPGSVNLMRLKNYLEPGQIDSKIDEYIEEVLEKIKLRSHIVQSVKNYLDNAGLKSAGVDAFHGAYVGSSPPKPLTHQEIHEILIELSSPLTGYLGREKGANGTSDQFYFLRDLTIFS